MSKHCATILWARGDAAFSDGRYSRAHDWQFDGGISVAASASPAVVPLPYASAAAVDPEEAYVAALAACHMLWFLDLARQAGFVVNSYRDPALGEMGKTDDGGAWVQSVHLRPKTTWQGAGPDAASLSDLHHRAHGRCFLAKSVKSEVIIHPG